jgi:D-3-phosphoglycerate dehydrogenase
MAFKVAWANFTFEKEVEKGLPSERFEVLPCQTQVDMKKSVSDADFLVVGRYVKASRDVIEKGRKLKLIQRAGRFWENHVDVDAATRAGIPVAVMPEVSTMSVAEHAITLMLALSKQLLEAHRSVISGEYEKLGLKPEPTLERIIPRWNWANMSPQVLYGKTLSIIGMGEIGFTVAERAKSFGMQILYHDVYRLPLRYEQEVGATLVPLETALKEADYVTLHAPHS